MIVIVLSVFSTLTFGSTILLDDSKGLSNNWTTALVKDRHGMIWVSTHSGLNTFDGYTFNEVPAFRNIRINCMGYDEGIDRLWLGTPRGLYYLDVATGAVTDCTVKSRPESVVSIKLWKGSAYVAFAPGYIMQLDDKLHCRVVFSFKNMNKQLRLGEANLFLDKNGTLFISPIPNKSAGIYTLNLNTGQSGFIPNIIHDEIWTIGECDTMLLVNTMKGIYLYDTGNKLLVESKAFAKLNHTIQGPADISLCKGNKLYAGFKNMRDFYVISHDSLDHLSARSGDVFRTKKINFIYTDENNITWIGTSKGLIKIYESGRYPFNNLLHESNAPISIRQIIPGNREDIYCATYNGIYKLDPATKSTERIDVETGYANFPLYFRTILHDSDYLYAGTESHEYFFQRHNLRKKIIEINFYKNASPGNIPGSAFSIIKDKHNTLWLATDRGLASYKPGEGKLVLHQSGIYSTGSQSLMYLYQPKNSDQFWAVGRGGAFLVDIHKGLIKKFNESSTPALVNDDVLFASEDAAGNIWLGTKHSGLHIISNAYSEINVINRSDGLSNNEVYAVLWQGRDTAWISTASGLCCYDVKNKTFRNFFTEHGLPDDEFNQNSFYKEGSNRFYFGGVNGITYFDPTTIVSRDPGAVKLFAFSITKWDRSAQAFINVLPEGDNKYIKMKVADHLLTFTFGLSDYRNTDLNTFYYRIKGIYNEWIPLGNQNTLRLDGLPAGRFTIEIKGFSRYGAQSANTLKYEISIVQVFYKTWWFYILVSFVFGVFVYLYFKTRIRKMTELQKLRTQIASNLHDEVGSLLTSIIISTDSARYSSDTLEEKDRKLEKVAALSRNATSTMSDVLWSIDARNDYAGNLTDRMREHAESMLLPLDMELEFDFSQTNQDQEIDPETRQQLYLIFKEAINNIARHSKATKVTVFYKHRINDIEMIITNNNPNAPATGRQNQGQGLKNMQMRAKKIGAQLKYVENAQSVQVHISSK